MAFSVYCGIFCSHKIKYMNQHGIYVVCEGITSSSKVEMSLYIDAVLQVGQASDSMTALTLSFNRWVGA